MDEITREDALQAAKAIARTKNGKIYLDYLVQEGGFYKPLGNSDPVKETKGVAVRDFVVDNVVELIK